jgi:Tol biopolymer transport system component
MPRIADALERESRTVDLEPGDFERLLGRRERKQRNRRIRAGVLGVIVTLALLIALTESMRSGSLPANPAPPKPLGAGEVLDGVLGLTAQDPDTGHLRTILDTAAVPGGGRVTAAAWSYDHSWVAFVASGGGSGGSIWVADTIGGAPRRVARNGRWTPWVWSPTEDQLALVRGRDAILIDAATGRETDLGPTARFTGFDGYAVRAMVWSPDGTRIAYSGGPGGGSVYSIDVGSDEHSMLVPRPSGSPWIIDIDWSPDGAHLAITYEDSNGGCCWDSLYLANADGSGSRLVDGNVPNSWPDWQPGMSVGTAWSPDGTRLAYTKHPGAGQVWTVGADGSAPSFVSAGGGPVWSPDGSRIAFAPPGAGDDPGLQGDRLVVKADGTGAPKQIHYPMYRSWDGGWFFCFCYG